MTHIIVTVSRFILIILFAIYTYDCFASLRAGISEERKTALYRKQTFLLYLILTDANAVLYLCTTDLRILALYLMEVVFFAATLLVFRFLYRHSQKALVNNMCMLLCVGFIILTRLDIDKAIRQFLLACAALIVSCLVPLFVQKLKFLNKLSWLYALIGIGGLGLVAVAGQTVYGAKLNISVGGIAIQPSEFIKILFVFFVAAMFYQAGVNEDRRQLLITTVVAALHVLILVASRDLGGAGIFFITYLCMFYVVTKRPLYLIGGGAAAVLGVTLAYFVMSHVRTRVIAWLNPLSDPSDAGYQICQSLFAIGTGGWFGSGLYQGMPTKIPVATTDFVFSAISEELGGFFALCLILVCMSCFLMMFNSALQIEDEFYKLVALGLGTVYASQLFMTLGGVTKFIPSTGVTLPLVSYGGSSLISTMILFAIIQGIYARRDDEMMKREIEREERERERMRRDAGKTKQKRKRKNIEV